MVHPVGLLVAAATSCLPRSACFTRPWQLETLQKRWSTKRRSTEYKKPCAYLLLVQLYPVSVSVWLCGCVSVFSGNHFKSISLIYNRTWWLLYAIFSSVCVAYFRVSYWLCIVSLLLLSLSLSFSSSPSFLFSFLTLPKKGTGHLLRRWWQPLNITWWRKASLPTASWLKIHRWLKKRLRRSKLPALPATSVQLTKNKR